MIVLSSGIHIHHHIIHYTRFLFGMWFEFNARGCRKLKRGNTGVSMYMSLARFPAVVLLLLLYRCCTARMRLKFRGSVGWNRDSSCSGWHAHIRTHAHTEAPFVAVTKIRYRYCYTIYRYCYTMAATTLKAYGVVQAPSSNSRQQSKNEQWKYAEMHLSS